jgi:hypothetical protein
MNTSHDVAAISMDIEAFMKCDEDDEVMNSDPMKGSVILCCYVLVYVCSDV